MRFPWLSGLIIAIIAVIIGTGVVEVNLNRARLKFFVRQLRRATISTFPERAADVSSSSTSFSATEKLRKHGADTFNKPEVVKVAEGLHGETVHVAIGYGLANVVLFDDGTDHGLVMVDAMESEDAMKEVMAAFASQMRGRRVDTLIFSHMHQDHTNGAGIVKARRIVAHALCKKLLVGSPTTGPITYKRAMRQFGVFLTPSSSATESASSKHAHSHDHGGEENPFLSCGIGPYLKVGEGTTSRLVLPTETFEGSTFEVRAGSHWVLTLIHSPGETPDHVLVHAKSLDLLVVGDNVYKAMSNVYAIRGTRTRDAMAWVDSIDTMRKLRPHILVPMHTRPVVGVDVVSDVLTHYRDALQFLHDQTLFWMNRGKTSSEIVQLVKLPPHLADHPWVQPFYGAPSWNVRAIFTHYLGWFSGDARELEPSAPGSFSRAILATTSAEAIVKAAQGHLARSGTAEGDVAAPMEAARRQQYEQRESAQLAVELSSIILDAVSDTQRIDAATAEAARDVRRRGFTRLAQLCVAATGRSYYSTWNRELDDELELRMPRSMARNNLLNLDRGEALLQAMSTNLNADASADVDWLVRFIFADTQERLLFHVRRGIAHYFADGQEWTAALVSGRSPVKNNDGNVSVNLELTVPKREAWVDLMVKHQSIVTLLRQGSIAITQGSMVELANFVLLFDSTALKDG